MRYRESESNTLEFKGSFPQNDQIIKTVIGFCNQYGGKLIIGVADDRTIKGLSDEEIQYGIEVLEKSVMEASTPSILPRVYIERFENDKVVLIIEVFQGAYPPYYLRREGLEKGTYIRLNRHTVLARQEQIEELKLKARGIAYETTPVYQATIHDLDESQLKNFFKQYDHIIHELSEESLRSYGLISYDQSKRYPSVAGLLLFGKKPQDYLTEAMIICTHFKSTEGRDSLATVDCKGTLFEQMNQALDFLNERLYKKFKIEKTMREEELEIPAIALRETIINAIVHRNYHIQAPTKIAIYDDRVEVFSPGQFPGPLRVDNLLEGISYLRNTMICKVFRRIGYVEKLGSGFKTIFRIYEKYHLKAPTVVEGENFIKCILPRGSYEQNIIKISDETTDDTKMIMKLLATNSDLQMSDLLSILHISRATLVRRLNNLISSGHVERIGQKKATRYRLKK